MLKWNFIIERTFLRPRDLIKFLNLALGAAKSRLSANPDTIDKITNIDIHAIRANYSTYLYEELRDEIIAKYPSFNQYMEILRELHYTVFTREQFTACYTKLADKFEFDAEPDIILSRLYEFSIIGFYKPGGGGFGGAEYRFQYASDYQSFNYKSQNFKVHAGFKEYLDLINK